MTALLGLPTNHGEYTLEKLTEFAEFLVRRNKVSKDDDKDSLASASLCIAVAGGGGHAISTLSSTPGASSIFLEGTITYDRKSYRDYVGAPSYTHRRDFKYASFESAMLASEAALSRAMTFRSGGKHENLRNLPGCIGVGCASALLSAPTPDAPSSIGHVVATRADGMRLYINITMAARSANGMKQNDCTIQRSRIEEDVVMSHLVLRSVDILRMTCPGARDDHEITTTAGDVIRTKCSGWPSTAIEVVEEGISLDYTIKTAAERVISEKSEVSMLVPTYQGCCASTLIELKYPVFPEGSHVFPGSFNPPHSGHVALANEAIRAAQDNAINFNMVYCKETPLFFELSLMNADKPTIDPQTVADRVKKFLSQDGLPHQWGILLTREPLFSGKLARLEKCMPAPELAPDITDITRPPRLSFVIGTDTMVRIINPKYYGNSNDNMIASLRAMTGAHYFVGGRLEQGKGPGRLAKFITGAVELESLPEDIKRMFTLLPEFRVDISSSEIRKGQ